MGCQDFPEPDEGPYDLHTGLYRDSGVQEARKHNCPVLSKCVGKGRRKPERSEVITICDHLRFLRFRQAEHEVFGKAFPVPFHRLVEGPR